MTALHDSDQQVKLVVASARAKRAELMMLMLVVQKYSPSGSFKSPCWFLCPQRWKALCISISTVLLPLRTNRQYKKFLACVQAPPSLPYESKVILGHRSQNQLLWSRNWELHRGQKSPQELTTHPSLLCNATCAQRENSFQNYPVFFIYFFDPWRLGFDCIAGMPINAVSNSFTPFLTFSSVIREGAVEDSCVVTGRYKI